jgi:hypothetical protein
MDNSHMIVGGHEPCDGILRSVHKSAAAAAARCALSDATSVSPRMSRQRRQLHISN